MRLTYLVRAIALSALLLISINTAVATNVTVEKVDVNYTPSNVSVEFHYQLDPVQKIKGLLFGAKYIKDDLLTLFSDTSDLQVCKVDLNHAQINLSVMRFNDTVYFPGENITGPVKNVTLTFPGGSTVKLNKTTKIPQAFYSLS